MGLLEDIKDPMAYFSRVAFNIWLKQIKKETDTGNWEIISLTELDASIGKCDEFLDKSNPLSWIDNFKNNDLHNVLTNLSEEEQRLITYVFYEGRTQEEFSKTFGYSQSKISKMFTKTMAKIRNRLCKK